MHSEDVSCEQSVLIWELHMFGGEKNGICIQVYL